MATMFDALIVGAGPAGSSAAILLARAGWSVALIEKQSFPRRKVCGECIAASNLPLLDALGIGAEFAALAGPPLRHVALLRRDRCIEAELPRAGHLRHRWGRALGRETLDTLLLAKARAAGAVVFEACAVQQITGAPGDHVCSVREPEAGRLRTLHARSAILAHGSWEPLPDARAARRTLRRGSDLFAFKANFEGATLAAGLLPVLSFEGGYGGMVLADQGMLTLACCIRADRLDALRHNAPGLPAGAVVERMLRRECGGVERALQGAERASVWLASGPLAPGVRVGARDALFRIGNAAGEAHPIVGEGMSMALQSAFLLCEELLGPGAHAHATLYSAAWQRDVQRRYAARWRKSFTMRLRLAALFAQLAMRPRAAYPLLALLAHWPALLTHGALWCGKTENAIDSKTIARFSSSVSAAGRFAHE